MNATVTPIRSRRLAGGGFVDGPGATGSFREDDHPRDAKGEFTDKGGSSGSSESGGAPAGESASDASAPTVDQTGWSKAQKESYAAKGSLQRPNFHAPTSDEERKAARVAPGYVDVWINDDPQGDLQAVGYGKTGEDKRFYSLEHDTRALKEKFERNLLLDAAVPGLWRQAIHDAEGGGKDAEKGAVVRLVLNTGSRIGGETASTFGATTLQKQHVTFPEESVAILDFWGKGGFRNIYRIEDPETVADLKTRSDAAETPETRLFNARATATLAYVKKAANGNYKNHDLRTWVATDAARRSFQAAGEPANEAEFWERREVALRVAANQINDGIGIAEDKYVNPVVFDMARTKLGIAADAERPKGLRQKDALRDQMPGYRDEQKRKQETDDE